MNPHLKAFNDSPEIKNSVKEFMVDVLKEIAVEKAFKGETVVGIPEASKLIERMFDRLEEEYTEEKKSIINNSR